MDVNSAGQGTGAQIGAEVGGALGYSAATVAYKAFNGLLPKAQLFVPKNYSTADASSLIAGVTGENESIALRAIAKKKKVAAKAAVSGGLTDRLKQAAGALPVISGLGATLVQQASLTATMASNNYSVMEVQYNPRSISISGNSGSMLRRPTSGDMGNQPVGITSKVSRLQLTVELIFEDINVSDAFHLEGLSMNAEELMKTAVSMGINTIKGGGFSVKKQCDGLMSLLNYKKLKQVVFVWGDMFFHGELTNVDVRYEMFNKLGNPILARVRLVLEQNDSEASIHYASDEDQWNDAIDIAFGPGLL